MANFEQALSQVSEIFKIQEFNSHQKAAFRTVINSKCDLLVNLPTGFGKAQIFQALPLVLDLLDKAKDHIVVVVSPLINLITDQVNYLNDLGVKACNISAIDDEEKRHVEEGLYKLVYGTPEAWLFNERWRSMFRNSTNISAVAVDKAHLLNSGEHQHATTWLRLENVILAAFMSFER